MSRNIRNSLRRIKSSHLPPRECGQFSGCCAAAKNQVIDRDPALQITNIDVFIACS